MLLRVNHHRAIDIKNKKDDDFKKKPSKKALVVKGFRFGASRSFSSLNSSSSRASDLSTFRETCAEEDDDRRRRRQKRTKTTNSFLLFVNAMFLNAEPAFAREILTATGEVFQGGPTAPEGFDSGANFVVVFVTVLLAGYGMVTSFENQAETTEAATLDRVSKQKEYMEKYAGKSGCLGMVSSSIMSDDGDDDTKSEEDGAKVLEARGCVGVVKVLSEETCRELLEHINSAIAKDSEDRTNPNFGNVYSRKNRFDYKLDLKQPTVRKAVKEASANLRQILAKTCGNRKIGGTSSDENQIELLELAALVSDPQSSRQPVHPDTNYRQNLCAVTTFIALQDVSEAMGPTLFIPETNTLEAHKSFQENLELGGPTLLKPNVKALLKTGDGSVFDSRLLHCGTENVSESRRVLFYITYGPKNAENPNRGFSTIREEFRGRYTLEDVCA